MIEIEREAPTTKRCDCCGGQTTSLVRYLSKNRQIHAVYFASFSDSHESQDVAVLLSLGGWAEHDESQRVAFAFRIWVTDGQPQVGIIDAVNVPLPDASLFGHKLSRAEALEHPWLPEVFHLSDHIVADDPEVLAYLRNVAKQSRADA